MRTGRPGADGPAVVGSQLGCNVQTARAGPGRPGPDEPGRGPECQASGTRWGRDTEQRSESERRERARGLRAQTDKTERERAKVDPERAGPYVA